MNPLVESAERAKRAKGAIMTTLVDANYPKSLTLQDATQVVVRPMVAADEDALLSFFLQLTEEDRYYLKDNVAARGVIAGWARDLDYDQVLPLLTTIDGRIVADATLHQHTGGARRHVAEVRVTVDPAFRGRGLGSLLLRELLDHAYRIDIKEVIFELVDGVQNDAIAAAHHVGFTEVARFPNYVKGTDGTSHDLVLLRAALVKRTWW